MVRRIFPLRFVASPHLPRRVPCLRRSRQAGAPVAGIVIDASGAPVAGASVTLEIKGRQPARTAETGVDGRFRLDEASGREGTLRVRANGFGDSVLPLDRRAAALRIVLLPRPLTESVTVTASRGATGVDTAASATIVSSAELLTSAAGAVDDALRNTPGFSLFRRSSSRVANPTTQGVTLRGVSGSGASRTLVVADGWALNDPFGSWVYWNRIPLAAVDRVEVVRGATGDLYGADALGGVIQVLTLDAERPRLRGLFEAGSHETYRASGFGGRRFGNWSLSGGIEVAEHRRRLRRRRRGAWVGRRAGVQRLSAPALAPPATAAERGAQRSASTSPTRTRGNGTPVQVNDTDWRQFAGEVSWRPGGRLLDGACHGRQPGLFPDVLGHRRRSPERTADQRPDGAWRLRHRRRPVDAHLEERPTSSSGPKARQTTADINETRYPVVGAAVSTSTARRRGEDRVSVRTRALHASSRFLAGARCARRSLGVHGLEELLQPAGVPDVAGERPGVAAVLGGALVSHADAQRALSRLPRRQHRHQRQSRCSSPSG